MSLQYIFILLFSGACAGFLSGLIGIGGGFIVVPLLMYVLPHMGISPDMVMKMAISTSMAVMIPTSIASLVHEYRGKRAENFDSETMRTFCLPAALGGVAGTLLITHIDNHSLTLLFLAYMSYAAILMIRPVKAKHVNAVGGTLVPVQREAFALSSTADASVIHTAPIERNWVDKFPAPIAGIGIGVFSALVGLGGATMVVLYLTARRFTIHSASVISNAVALSLALAATVTVAVSGNLSNRIHWPAMIMMAVSSIIFSGLGVSLKNKTPHATLRQIFGLVLLLVVGMTLFKIYG